MPNNEPAESLDLLVYPFYTLSKIASRFRIDEESERNILSLKSKWMDSISDVSRCPRRYFVLINGTDLPDKLLIQNEMTNPYRGLYREVVRHARQSLGSRLFYFFPTLSPNSFSIKTLDERLNLAHANDSNIVYDSKGLKISAYGEHADKELKAGCVDLCLRNLLENLKVQPSSARIDYDKSLPSIPSIRVTKPYFGFETPTTLYITIVQLEELSSGR